MSIALTAIISMCWKPWPRKTVDRSADYFIRNWLVALLSIALVSLAWEIFFNYILWKNIISKSLEKPSKSLRSYPKMMWIRCPLKESKSPKAFIASPSLLAFSISILKCLLTYASLRRLQSILPHSKSIPLNYNKDISMSFFKGKYQSTLSTPMQEI